MTLINWATQTASWVKPWLSLLLQLSGPGSEFSVQGGIQVEAAHFLAGCGVPKEGGLKALTLPEGILISTFCDLFVFNILLFDSAKPSRCPSVWGWIFNCDRCMVFLNHFM